MEEDIQLLKSLRADLVVGDFRPSLAISAPVAGVPYMNIVNAHWSPWSQEPFEVPALLDIAPVQWMGFRFGKKFLDAVIPLVFRRHSRAFNQVRREYGLASLAHGLQGVYSAGDYTAYADLPTLAPTPGAPAHHRHIGPVLWEPEVPLPAWWADLPADKPLVYLSAGSSGRTDFLPRVLEALADLPVAVAVATAGRVSVAPVPGRVYVADYLPGLPLCHRAAFVTNNGGAGGVAPGPDGGDPRAGDRRQHGPVHGDETRGAVGRRSAGVGGRSGELSLAGGDRGTAGVPDSQDCGGNPFPPTGAPIGAGSVSPLGR